MTNIKSDDEKAFQWLIHIYELSSQNPQGMVKTLKSIELIWPSNSPCKAALILLTEAEISQIQGNYQHTTKDVSKAIRILEGVKNQSITEKKLVCLAYNAFARLSKYTNEEKEGLEYGFKALELANTIDFKTGKVLAHNQIGLLINYFQNDRLLALEHYLKANELIPELPKKAQQLLCGIILSNIAQIWSHLGETEKSINYRVQVLEKEKDNKNIKLLFITHNNLGGDYHKLKQYDLAEKHLQKSLDLMEEYHFFANKGFPLLRMGQIHLEKGKLDKAKYYAEAVEYWLVKHQFVGSNIVRFYQLKSQIAKADNDFKQAIFWLEKAAIIQDSLDNKISSNSLLKLEVGHKFKEIKQELVFLEKEKAANKVTIQYQKIKILTVGLIAFLAFLFSFVLYQHHKKEIKNTYSFALKNRDKEVLYSNPKKLSDNQLLEKEKKEIDQKLKLKIINALEKEKLFLSPILTLKKFADCLDSNTSYVSKTINEGFGKNFSGLINEYRINEVLKLFNEGQHHIYTIEFLCKKAGFNSKSSFQKAFKAKMGVTASHYLERV